MTSLACMWRYIMMLVEQLVQLMLNTFHRLEETIKKLVWLITMNSETPNALGSNSETLLSENLSRQTHEKNVT